MGMEAAAAAARQAAERGGAGVRGRADGTFGLHLSITPSAASGRRHKLNFEPLPLLTAAPRTRVSQSARPTAAVTGSPSPSPAA